MSLPFLADQCVSASITNALRSAGHSVALLREILPIRALDPVVLAQAQELNSILVSLNGDFSDIVAYPPASHGGIISIQLHNHPETTPQLMAYLTEFLEAHPDRHIRENCYSWKCTEYASDVERKPGLFS